MAQLRTHPRRSPAPKELSKTEKAKLFAKDVPKPTVRPQRTTSDSIPAAPAQAAATIRGAASLESKGAATKRGSWAGPTAGPRTCIRTGLPLVAPPAAPAAPAEDVSSLISHHENSRAAVEAIRLEMENWMDTGLPSDSDASPSPKARRERPAPRPAPEPVAEPATPITASAPKPHKAASPSPAALKKVPSKAPEHTPEPAQTEDRPERLSLAPAADDSAPAISQQRSEAGEMQAAQAE